MMIDGMMSGIYYAIFRTALRICTVLIFWLGRQLGFWAWILSHMLPSID